MADATTASDSPTPSRPDKRGNPTLRERVDALRNLPPFLREIWATSRVLTSASLGLRLIRALLPVITLYIGKLIIDEAVRLVGAGAGFDTLSEAWRSGQLDHLLSLLGLELALAILSDLLGRLISYADGVLSELFTNATKQFQERVPRARGMTDGPQRVLRDGIAHTVIVRIFSMRVAAVYIRNRHRDIVPPSR